MNRLRAIGEIIGGLLLILAIWLVWHERTKQVVTILPGYVFSHEYDAGIFEVRGTWTLEDEAIAWPTQTTTIQCERTANRCIEASAVLPELRLLFPVKITTYAISRWDNDVIIFQGPSAKCVSETYQVNLQTEIVTGLSVKRKDAPMGLCEHVSREPKRMRMIDGYKASMARRSTSL